MHIHTTIIVQVSNATKYYANSRIKGTKCQYIVYATFIILYYHCEKSWALWFQRVKDRFVWPAFRSEYSDRNAGKTNLSFTRWNQRTQPFSPFTIVERGNRFGKGVQFQQPNWFMGNQVGCCMFCFHGSNLVWQLCDVSSAVEAPL